MPSSWSPSLRFELQFTGENINLWGDKLNAVLDHADFAIAGWQNVTLTAATYALTTANAGDDEARAAVLKLIGTPATTVALTIPSVSKIYLIWNACGRAVTITTGSGATVTLDDGDIVTVLCDGANVKQPGYGGLGLKDYITSFSAGSGAVPSPIGNVGKFLYAQSSSAVIWKAIASTDLSDYAQRILGVQVALAVAL